ncbi:MAG: hypothetical protein HOP12_07040 [Candidatus Eisenbacteria bacterium]|uniref:Uncharacterized protein n=1 Tax=Eiseniibacteriota bacterium TaxID=2212470 RepID=A0A849SXQ1_UNCEI|nr:hypothetical protein [Candidatus Eisenbacteria bacterium]
MKPQSIGTSLRALVLAVLAVAVAAPQASAQQILLDKLVKAGELTLFPDLNNPSLFYYVPDKVRLATDANGTPQFSFLRYVENVRSGADQAEAREGDGGGIVHALVTLGVSDEQRSAALRELQRTHPGATIQGPILFKSGRFGLVSAFADPKGNLTKQVVGLGNAPLLDGEKAAVSIQLTKLGSKILWESFNMPAPDVSFHFEMDMSGYRSPKRATIDADWSKVYEHKAFNGAIATNMLAAEVSAAYDDLRSTSAIKVTQIGEDEKMNQIVEAAYKMIQERMFEPTGGTGTPSLTDLSSMGHGSQPSLLDRATTRLKEAQAATEAENVRTRAENKDIAGRNDKARLEQGKVAGATFNSQLAEQTAIDAESEAVIAKRRAKVAAEELANAKAEPAGDDVLDKAAKADPAELQKQVVALQKAADEAQARATKLRADANKLRGDAALATATAAPTEASKSEKAAPTLSIMASLQIKKVKQTGTFHFDMNKYTPENLTLPFDENIGDLRRLKNDASHFRQVNLDDPLFKQRELVAMVDGVSAQDFGQFVNFVSVQMRKKHASGEETNDEVRVDRNNFNKEGNNFKLLYGWKGDDDRRRWMEYEVQSTWSFFGGKSVVEPWRKANAGAINLAPPIRRRTVMLDGNVETLQQSEVRAVTVKLYYDVAGSEQSKQVTLNVAKGQIAEKLELLAPPDHTQYAYEITWQLKGNRSVSSPRQTTVSDILYVDELPATSASGALPASR